MQVSLSDTAAPVGRRTLRQLNERLELVEDLWSTVLQSECPPDQAARVLQLKQLCEGEQAAERIIALIVEMDLAEAIAAEPSATIVEREATYLHATFSSRIFGFVDDVELLASQPDSLEARSISRLGDSDLGVNGQRLQRLSEVLPAH